MKEMAKQFLSSRAPELLARPGVSPTTLARLGRLAEMRGETPEQTAWFVLEKLLGSNVSSIPDYDPRRSTAEKNRLTYQYLWGLSDRLMAKLEALASLRQQPLSRTWRQITKNAAAETIPGKLYPGDRVRDLEFEEVSLVDHHTARITLPNGRTFYGFPSKTRYVHLYSLLKDVIPPGFSAETYAMGVDAAMRYWKGANYLYVPGEGETVIECGAYVGFKAIRYADLVGPLGKVVAVEIDRENFALLERNISTNGLQEAVTAIRCGVWNKKGEMEDRHEDRIYHTLADVEEKRGWKQRTLVPVDTLANIMDDCGLESVDLINIQVNGAEVEALEGLDRRLDDVKVLRIAAYYTDEHGRKADQVVAFLKARGAEILERTEAGSIVAVTAPHVEEVRRRLLERGVELTKG